METQNPVKNQVVANQVSPSNQLIDHIDKVFIIAHEEPTQQLEDTFAQEHLACEVLRQQHRAEYQGYSPSFLCLLNHRCAWEKALTSGKPTLIVEADFVPVRGFGKLPVPFKLSQPDVGITWLYTCAPQVYSVTPEGYAEGYSTSMVAYLVTPAAAQALIELSDHIQQTVGPTNYSAWDSGAEKFLRERGLKSYIAFRNYGEHGGRPNPEHQQNGLSRVHRADVLYGPLAFVPLYALDEKTGQTQQITYLSERFQARLKGAARLLAGKFVKTKVLRYSSFPGRILRFAVGRQIAARL